MKIAGRKEPAGLTAACGVFPEMAVAWLSHLAAAPEMTLFLLPDFGRCLVSSACGCYHWLSLSGRVGSRPPSDPAQRN